MTEQGNSPLKGNAKPNLDEMVQEDAKTTDSWLIYLYRDLGKAVRWSRDELALWGDSAKSAYDTTKKISKNWCLPQVLADRANDGFLFVARFTGKAVRSVQSGTGKGVLSVVRSTGRAAHFVQSGTTAGLSKIKQALSRKKEEEESEQQSESVEATSPVQDVSPVAAADIQQEAFPSSVGGEEAKPVESTPAPVREEKPPPEVVLSLGVKVSKEAAEEISEKEDVSKGAIAGKPETKVPFSEEKKPKKSGSRSSSDRPAKAAGVPKKSSARKKPTSTGRRKQKGSSSTKN